MFILVIVDFLTTTTKLQVYLSHWRCGSCEYIEYLPSFIHMQIYSEGTIEWIQWTKMLKDHFQDLEVISNSVYKDYVACILAQSRSSTFLGISDSQVLDSCL
jgi:hypothetical protein